MTHKQQRRFLDYELFASSKPQKGILEAITLRKSVFGPLYEVQISFQKSSQLQSIKQEAIRCRCQALQNHIMFRSILLKPCCWNLRIQQIAHGI